MDREELEVLVNIVLEKDLDDLKRQILVWKLTKQEDKKIISYEHSDTLIDIFSNIQNESTLREEFIKILEASIKDSFDYEVSGGYGKRDTYASTCPLSFYTLIKLGFIENALDALAERARIRKTGAIFNLISAILSEDYSYFDLKQIFKLLEAIKLQKESGYYAGMYQNNVISTLRSTAYEHVKKDIRGINFEINKDKEEVKIMISYLDFDEKYNQLLNEIDKFINQESGVLSSGMIGNLRSFMEDLLTDLAKKIAAKENEDIPKNEGLGSMGNIRTYLKRKLELSDNDNSFINQYINVLHSEGGHSFVSNKQYFRLARNIGIEISLLILSKYKSKYS